MCQCLLKKPIILMGALLLGLIIPFAFIYIKELLNIKIKTKQDVERLSSTPVLAELPKVEKGQVRAGGNERFFFDCGSLPTIGYQYELYSSKKRRRKGGFCDLYSEWRRENFYFC